MMMMMMMIPLANPKSVIRNLQSFVTSRLPGLRSLWIIRLSCKYYMMMAMMMRIIMIIMIIIVP